MLLSRQRLYGSGIGDQLVDLVGLSLHEFRRDGVEDALHQATLIPLSVQRPQPVNLSPVFIFDLSEHQLAGIQIGSIGDIKPQNPKTPEM